MTAQILFDKLTKVDKFNKLFFIDDLLLFSPRQGGNALNTADYIEKTLKTHRVSFVSEKFQTQVPLTVAVLKVDGKKMSCEGCSFLSGKILGKDAIASSLIPSRFLIDFSNINFNPKCNGISVSNFYFSPSIAVSRKDISTIIKAKKIFVVDCVGNGKTSIINDQKIANLAFPIRSIEKIIYLARRLNIDLPPFCQYHRG